MKPITREKSNFSTVSSLSKHFLKDVREITYEYGKEIGKDDKAAKRLAARTVGNIRKTWSVFADEN